MHFFYLFAANMHAIAFYISDSIDVLASRTKELVMDATFGTNSTGMSLFAVLAEVDGTGVSLAYSFMDTFEDNSRGVRQRQEQLQPFWINSYAHFKLQDAIRHYSEQTKTF